MKRIFLVAMSCLLSGIAFAQASPQFYNTFSGSTVNNFPLNSPVSNKAQWIFAPNSFNASGTGVGAAAFYGFIKKIYVKLGNTVSATAAYTNFSISLSQGVGTNTSFGTTSGSAYNFVTGMSTVFNQASGFTLTGATANQWYGFNLNDSFLYRPWLSLVLEIKTSSGVGNRFALTPGGAVTRLYGGFSSAVGTNAVDGLNFGFNITPTVLPINLASFTGHKENTYDQLNWVTSTEENCSFFTLQHSTDGQHFSNIDVVKSLAQNGNSQAELQYSTSNQRPVIGHNYYRLQQTDIDGHTSIIGKVIDLTRESVNNPLTLFPVPCTNEIQIQFDGDSEAEVVLNLCDLQGRMLKTMTVNQQIGTNRFTLPTQQLVPGYYLVQVVAEESKQVQRFEKK